MPKQRRDMTEPELQAYFQLLGEATESVLPPGPSRHDKALFVLVVFDDPGLAQYVSNAEREDVIKALREMADRLERRQDVPR